MSRQRIVLAGISPKLQGLRWESEKLLRIGRNDGSDIVLQDLSVCRQHAEVFGHGSKWVIRDLANHDKHPTLVNGTRVGRTECKLRKEDVLQVGTMILKVAELDVEQPAAPAPPPPPTTIKATGSFLRVEATAQNSWDEALVAVTRAGSGRPLQGQHLLALLRTNQNLVQIASLDELLNSLLANAVEALDAQRGSIVLADPLTGQLQLRTVQAPKINGNLRRTYSKTLADRCFTLGESLLCCDANAEEALLMARSVRHGEMSSLICALLRSPRKRLGVMQLDRGPLQEPFDQSDFYLADAIAASVSVGIESAQLVEAQRTQFIETVTTLARAVDMRDQYTGDHTRRVTDYSLMLADELKLDALERYQVQIGTPLHDIGKIGIDDAILRKPGKLTTSEFESMKQHTIKGAEILASINNLSPMIPIVRSHHEKWDGSGYPDGLSRTEIARTARVVAVADAFDAMTSDRPYRQAMPAAVAFGELLQKAGTHFDPACVQAFLRVRPKVEAMLKA